MSVIIAAHNAAATLGRTLDALSRQDLAGRFEVIVVDDGSVDETASIARRYEPLVRLISTEKRGGAGAARNRGVEVARGEALAFTDADCYPTSGWLRAGLAALAHSDLVQGAVEPDPSARRTPFDRSLAVERDRGFYQTANLIVRREVFELVSGFRDWALESGRWSGASLNGPNRKASLKPVGEDTLFGWMACRRGARSAFAPEALVYHAVFPGGLLDDIADRWHWARHMGAVVKLVPELRETVLYRRVFFNHWTAQFDLALVGLLASLAARRRLAIVAVLPYVRRVTWEATRYGRSGAIQATLGAPLVEGATFVGLVVGSVVARSPIL